MNAVTDPELLDESTLSELAGDDGTDIVGVLVEGFLEEAEGRIEAIRAATREEDGQAVGFQAHALKSTSATYGAPRLSRLAAIIERAARDADCDTVASALEDLDPVWQATLRAFRTRYLAGGSGAV